jgi:methane/ammonia monooxygenase subunit B
MVDRKVMAFALAAVFVVGVFGPNVATMIQTAEGHGVQAQLQSRFIRIEDETFNRQSLQTGEVLTLAGSFVSLIDSDMRAWSSIFSESTNAGNRWEILARDPPGNVFDIPGNDVVDYEISARALEPGVYHVHIPYTNIAYQSIIIAVGYVITFATRPWQVI